MELVREIIDVGIETSPRGTRLWRQRWVGGESYALAPYVVTLEPKDLLNAFDRIVEEVRVKYRDDEITADQVLWHHIPKAEIASRLPPGDPSEMAWDFFAFRVKAELDANLKLGDINQAVFFYDFFQGARKTLKRSNFFCEPFFHASPLREGSVLMDILFGAGTVAGSFAMYPKVRDGFLAALSDARSFRKWLTKALSQFDRLE